MLPLLPSYLAGNGLSAALIGVVMAAYFAASVFSQYPAGALSDRVGRRPVLFSGLLIFSLGSFGFALTSGALVAICFRGLQGIGAGAFTVAAAATIGVSVRLSERGRAFGALYGSQMLALAVGPLVGSSIGASSIRLLFVIGAAIALLAARFDRRKLAIGALGSTALFAAYYPFIHSVRILVALGLFEAGRALVGSPEPRARCRGRDREDCRDGARRGGWRRPVRPWSGVALFGRGGSRGPEPRPDRLFLAIRAREVAARCRLAAQRGRRSLTEQRRGGRYLV